MSTLPTVNTPAHRDRAKAHLAESAEVKKRVAESCLDSILEGAQVIVDTFRAGGKLYLCGNGGSAADCQHMAAEFVSRLTIDFDRPALPAIALTTDTSFLTAYANDVDFEGIFARQVHALGRPGDALLGISTSGTSKNVRKAFQAARELGLRGIGLCGAGPGLKDYADVIISVPSTDTQFIQESHLAIEHILCDLVEQTLFAKDDSAGRPASLKSASGS